MLIILDNKQRTIGVATNSNPYSLPYWNDIHTETLEGVSTYEFLVPAQHEDSEKIQTNGHVIVRDLDGNHLLFTIKQVSEQYSEGKLVKKVFCENTAIDELLGDVVRPMSLSSSSLKNTAQLVLNNSAGWGLGEVDVFDSRDFVVDDYSTVLEVLRKIEKEYFVEIYFTIKLNGTQIERKEVNIVKERGNDTFVRFEYGYDLRGVSRTEDSSRVITALVLAGKGDSKGERITLKSQPAFKEGDFYKLENSDWIGSESALQRWSKDGNHIFGIYIDDEADSQHKLKYKGIAELEKRITPDVVYSCAVSTLERLTGYQAKRLRIGDRVHIKDTTFTPPIAISGRVTGLVRSYTDSNNDTVDLGSYKPLSLTTSREIKKIQEKISKKEEKWNTSSYKVEIISSNGLIFRSGNVSTVLEARVFEGAEDITDKINSAYFIWKRKSNDSEGDRLWNMEHAGGTKSITITPEDVQVRATFYCELVAL